MMTFRHRVRLFARAGEIGVAGACRELVERHGLEILMPRERRRARMPNQLAPWLEQQVLARALGSPGLGPRRLAAQLRRPIWEGHLISPSGVFKVLRRNGIATRQRRLSLVAGYASPPETEPPPQLPGQYLDVHAPGDLVQLNCFHIGRLTGTKGKVWQFTAIDAYSSYTWATVHVTPMNPSARYTSTLVHQVAMELSQAGGPAEGGLHRQRQ